MVQQLVDQATLALNLAQSRYQLGLSSIVELTQAQLNLTQALIEQVNATYDLSFTQRTEDIVPGIGSRNLIARGNTLGIIAGASSRGNISATRRRNNLHAQRTKRTILTRIRRIVGEGVLVANITCDPRTR